MKALVKIAKPPIGLANIKNPSKMLKDKLTAYSIGRASKNSNNRGSFFKNKYNQATQTNIDPTDKFLVSTNKGGKANYVVNENKDTFDAVNRVSKGHKVITGSKKVNPLTYRTLLRAKASEKFST